MNTRAILIRLLFLPALASAAVSSSRAHTLPDVQVRVAVLPFEVQGLSSEEGLQLTRIFRETLSHTESFIVMHPDTMMGILTEAGVTNLDGCNYSYCLADLAKVLGVGKVVHVSVTRRGKLYVARVRLVNAEDAEVVYDQRAEHSGEFSTLASDVVPAEARRLAETRVEAGTKWYVYVAAVLVGVGAIYWIYRSFTKDIGEEGPNTGPPSTQQ